MQINFGISPKKKLYIYINRRFLNFDQNLQDYQNEQSEISYSVNPVNSENSGSDNGEYYGK
jgi:hypothetical protein